VHYFVTFPLEPLATVCFAKKSKTQAPTMISVFSSETRGGDEKKSNISLQQVDCDINLYYHSYVRAVD
jgi:hypothetical protein